MEALCGQHNIDSKIVLTGLAHTVLCMAIEQQDIACAHFDLAVLDHVGDLTAGNIGHFNIVMAVSGKIGKTGMAAQCDLLAVLHQAVAVDNKFLGKGGIKSLVDSVLALQYLAFLFVDLRKTCQDILSHDE